MALNRAGGTVDLGPESLGEALRLLRHRGRCSRDQLAQFAGVSAGAISNYENDVSAPAAHTLRGLCRELAVLLGVDVATLWEQLGLLLDQRSGARRGDGPDVGQARVVGDEEPQATRPSVR